MQHEFDALVSVAYNPGGSFTPISDLINAGEVAEAMASIKSRVHSNGLVLPGLVSRRNGEVAMYLYGRYEKG